jgi:flagellar hook-length control protein FliK
MGKGAFMDALESSSAQQAATDSCGAAISLVQLGSGQVVGPESTAAGQLSQVLLTADGGDSASPLSTSLLAADWVSQMHTLSKASTLGKGKANGKAGDAASDTPVALQAGMQADAGSAGPGGVMAQAGDALGALAAGMLPQAATQAGISSNGQSGASAPASDSLSGLSGGATSRTGQLASASMSGPSGTSDSGYGQSGNAIKLGLQAASAASADLSMAGTLVARQSLAANPPHAFAAGDADGAGKVASTKAKVQEAKMSQLRLQGNVSQQAQVDATGAQPAGTVAAAGMPASGVALDSVAQGAGQGALGLSTNFKAVVDDLAAKLTQANAVNNLADTASQGFNALNLAQPAASAAEPLRRERVGATSTDPLANGAGLGIASATPLGVGPATPTGAGGSSSDSAYKSPEEVVAEQVSYWITQKRQSAQLTLDGGGGQPVAVSISMVGNEAHVAFSSNQAHTRDMLNGALPDLKNLLQGEGIILAGVSVGGGNASNGQSFNSGSPASQSDAVRRAGALSGTSLAQSQAVVSTGTRRVSSDRTLDLFV